MVITREFDMRNSRSSLSWESTMKFCRKSCFILNIKVSGHPSRDLVGVEREDWCVTGENMTIRILESDIPRCEFPQLYEI